MYASTADISISVPNAFTPKSAPRFGDQISQLSLVYILRLNKQIQVLAQKVLGDYTDSL